ncbi:Rieske 2Fe-2S domain-containing protein [Dactylosporangium sp. CA-139066]|uniref:Rieske 2Fe-2S domain-containing protein n=1 Tax=Dactylosporangium sp. CA-139066 TaxID=3239930 RepID=UPI003D8F3865
MTRLEGVRSLDRIGDRLRRFALATVGRGRLGDALHGRWFGHPLHPAAVQVPVGAWTSAAMLDLVPGTGPAATALLTVGTAAAVPTAATGWADFATLSPQQRRVAVVHAAANVTAVGLMAASVVARLRGHRRRGQALTLAGLGVASAGAYLGGHLAYSEGAGVSHATTALPQVPVGWHEVAAVDTIPDGQAYRRTIGETPVMVYRDQDRFTVLIARCAHQGGPLPDGRMVDVDGDQCIECPWHGSVFRLRDGKAMHGPAASDQPRLRTRVRDGRLEAALL